MERSARAEIDLWTCAWLCRDRSSSAPLPGKMVEKPRKLEDDSIRQVFPLRLMDPGEPERRR
jgi:hypothetical protein